ncbi:MAG: AraC family transcriptional regulator [Oscillospiraceae bacterium]
MALSVGYGNLNYFYQQFHDYFNMSPLEMRKNGGKFIPAEPPHS